MSRQIQHPSTAQPGALAAAAGGLARRCDERTLFMFYFVTIFASRLLLRSPWASGLHWAVAMGLEDGMSLLSFVLGLFYLHHTNGAPLAILAKRVAASPEGAAAAAAVLGARDDPAHRQVEGTQPGAVNTATRQPVRLFYFAM